MGGINQASFTELLEKTKMLYLPEANGRGK
jgi:hypothetical protein